VRKSSPATAPVAILDDPPHLSPSCSELRLSAKLSYGFMGRKAEYKWQITGSWYNFVEYNSFNTTHSEIVIRRGAMVNINAPLAKETLDVILTVRNAAN
jgi:hypothetical protein